MPCKGWTRRNAPVDEPDGMTWTPGRFVTFRELGGSFGPKIEREHYVLTIVDCDIEEAREIFQAREPDDDLYEFETDDREQFLRVISFDVGALPVGVQSALELSGCADVTLAELRVASTHAIDLLPGF
jgi:hypothetical protein